MQMKDISFFCKLPFLNIHPHVPFSGQRRGKLMRISSLIRCQQIAEHLGAKVNPENNYENDICIYVKPDFMFNDHYGEMAYIDVIDSRRAIYVLKDHPKFIGIACSIKDMHFLRERVGNKIIHIPQHHCNFEESRREFDNIQNVGMIGSVNLMPYFPEILKAELAKRKINLVNFTSMYSRQDVCNFYKTIDLQIVWRPYNLLLSNPLKIINAASFGIPTIALQEPAFKEVDDIYFSVNSEIEFIETLDRLIEDRQLRQNYSLKCLNAAKCYHIDKVAEQYSQLCMI
jgi:glycosyltransferase involved in cell wall biosynthesis